MESWDLVSEAQLNRVKLIKKAEEEVIVKALSGKLGFSPRTVHFRDCVKQYTLGNPINYDLIFRNNKIGSVYFLKNEVKFIPKN
jgi:hypothetical protein